MNTFFNFLLLVNWIAFSIAVIIYAGYAIIQIFLFALIAIAFHTLIIWAFTGIMELPYFLHPDFWRKR